jgi:hypothetical protein
MAGVTARLCFLLFFGAVISHLSAHVVANHAYYRYYEYHVYEVRSPLGEYPTYSESKLLFSNWALLWILCTRFEHGNRCARRRMTLAYLRRRRRDGRRLRACMTACQVELPTFMTRPDLHKWITRNSTCTLLPSAPSLLHLLFSIMLLLLCGDIETNPGPHPLSAVCLHCDKVGRKNQRRLKCDSCDTFYHVKCLRLTNTEIKLYTSTRWLCWSCSLPGLSNSFFNDSITVDTNSGQHTLGTAVKKGNNTRLLCFNARSIKDNKKKGDLISMITANDPDIICVNETWLDQNIKSSEIFDHTIYTVIRKDRYKTRGGGVLLALKSHINHCRLPHLESDAEIIWCELNINGHKILFGSAYRSPSNNEDANNNLLKSLELAGAESDKFDACILAEDFNLRVDWSCDVPRPSDNLANRFLAAFYDFVPFQIVDTPTRVVGDKSSLIDLLLCDNQSHIIECNIIPGVSDHFAIYATLNFYNNAKSTQKKEIYDYKLANWIELKKQFLTKLPVIFVPDIDLAWDEWKAKFWECVNICIPKKLVRGNKAHPWITRNIINLINKRNRLFKAWRSNPSCNDTHHKYLCVKKKLRQSIKSAHEQYMWLLGRGRGGQQRLWKYLHAQNGDNKHVTISNNDNPTSVADQFADSFCNNYSYDNSNNLFPRKYRDNDANLSNIYISPYVVLEMLQSIRTSAAAGPDDIPSRLLHDCAASLSPSLSALYNLSLSLGLVPTEWKAANVIPVFKSGKRCDVSNYRPISITSSVCKVLEKIINKTMLEFLKHTNQIPIDQHGFLPKRSCNTMLLYIIDQWQKTLDVHSGGHIHVISLDWEKAFDRIPHSRLIWKLKNAGITGNLLKWLQSYLDHRVQRVLVNGVFSKWTDVPSGVIQGSVLGPLLFNIFVSDLPLSVTSKLVMYADDSTLYRHISSYEDEVKLQEDLANIEVWSNVNGMSLNVSKCYFMDVTLSRFRRYGRYELNNVLISHTNNIKLLGINISYNLSWNLQTDYVRARSAKVLGFLCRSLRGCSSRVKRQAYLTLVRPIITYGIPAWHPTSKDNIHKLQLIQNRASRSIYGKSCSHELDKIIMTQSNYLSYLDLLYFYKSRNGSLDLNITDSVTNGRPIRGQEGVTRLIPPKVRTTMYQQGFVYRCVSAWNGLPSYIKLVDDKFVKLYLKNHFTAS